MPGQVTECCIFAFRNKVAKYCTLQQPLIPLPNLRVRAQYKKPLEMAGHDTADFKQSGHRPSRNLGPGSGDIASLEDLVAQTISVALFKRVSTPPAASPLVTRARGAKSGSSHPRIHVWPPCRGALDQKQPGADRGYCRCKGNVCDV